MAARKGLDKSQRGHPACQPADDQRSVPGPRFAESLHKQTDIVSWCSFDAGLEVCKRFQMIHKTRKIYDDWQPRLVSHPKRRLARHAKILISGTRLLLSRLCIKLGPPRQRQAPPWPPRSARVTRASGSKATCLMIFGNATYSLLVPSVRIPQ